MNIYRLVVRQDGNLLSVILRQEIDEAQLAAIRTILRIHDHDDEAPCYCAFQFPDSCSLTMLWADARRRANLVERRTDSGFRQPGEIVNGLYPVVEPTGRFSSMYVHDPALCTFCRRVGEQCHADLDCQHRAWADGYCFSHREAAVALLKDDALRLVRSDTDRDHEMMVANDTID